MSYPAEPSSHDPFAGAVPAQNGAVRAAQGGAADACGLTSLEREAAARLAGTGLAVERRAHYATRRRLLAELTGFAAGEIELAYSDAGAPRLVNAPHVAISISRSGPWTCVAAGRVGQIGVDIERRRARDWAAMLDMISAADEAALWRAHLSGCEDPDTEFLKLWTIKEAVLKAYGRGFAAGAKTVPVNPAGAEIVAFGIRFDLWTVCAADYVVSLASAPPTSAG